MKTNFAYRLVSFVSSLSILLQSFAPLAYITPQTVFSQEPLKNTITYNNSKGVFHFEVNNKDAEVTSGPISYTLLYKNELTGQFENVNGTTDLSDSNFTRDIDAATCSSGGVCVNHVVHQGLMKVKVDKADWFDSQWFKIEAGSLVVKHQYATGSVTDLTSDEEHWLNTGEEMTPSPTPTVEPTVEPTTEPTVTPTEVPTPTVTIVPTVLPSLGDEEVQVRVVKLDGSYADATLVPETWTDKMDYAPTEKVIVSGKNFIADYEYTIIISSSDDPAVTHTGTFISLADGTFTYEYQLDGNYRPNYAVQIKDASGTVVAGTTFTDSKSLSVDFSGDGSGLVTSSRSGISCTSTVGNRSGTCNYSFGDRETVTLTAVPSSGFSLTNWNVPSNFSNKVGCGTSDTTCQFNLNNHAGTVVVTFDTPITTNPSLTQACGLDIGLVLDVSGSIDNGELTTMKNAFKGMVDALNGTPTQFSVTQFDTTASVLQTFTSDFSQTKTKIDSASGGDYTNWEDGLIKSYSTFDPRAGKPNLIIFASDGNPNRVGTSGTNATETQAVNAAKLVANTVKTAGTRILTVGIGNDLDTNNLKAISGNSVNTGSVLTSDVITTDFAGLATQLGNFAKQTCGGKISINKYVDGVQKSDGKTWSFSIDGTTTITTDSNGQVASGTLSVGNHTVTEVSIPSGYTYDHATCTSGVVNPTSPGIKDIAVTADSIITCNFYNTTNKGSITIVKDAQPNNAQDFAFTTTGTGVSNFSLDDDADATLSNTKTFSNLMPGTFTFVEGVTSGWTLDSITCGTGGTVDLANRKATIVITPGLSVTCTYVNKPTTGTVIVHKDVTGPSGEAVVDTSNSFTVRLDDTNPRILKDGETTTYTSVSAGSHKISEDAVPSAYTLYSITPDSSSVVDGAQITVPAGGTLDVYVVNRQKPATLTLNKAIVNTDGGTKVASEFGAYIDGNAVTWGVPTAISINSEHTVTEGNLAHYTPSNWGTDCSADGKITLLPGENKVCTITNTYIPYCGDGFKTATEECDDGNTVDTDACLNTCKIAVCGDGVKSISEECDDGNGVNTDSCTNGCKLSTCGDGYLQYGIEQCDNGYLNTETACTAPYGGSCTYCNTSCSELTVTGGRCGDGIKNGSEECDDGNTVNTDACLNTCVNATCGDGVVSSSEECDDANSVNTDACTNTCKLPVCGDGYLYRATESCDRGSDNTDIACTAPYGGSCTYCTASCSEETVTGPSCGDGIINGTEQCDGTNLGDLSATDFRCNSCSLELINSKVTICHSTSSQNNPYIVNTPDKSGDVSGHDGHNGPVWYPGITVDWGDIIPAFAYIGGTYPGQNWTTEGQAIYDNGCELPKAKLIVKKEVINDNGGTKGVTDFSFKVGTASAVAFEADGQNDLSVDPGIYTITEPSDSEYATTYDNCSNVTVPIGGSATCTITNDDKEASLTLTKVVINDNGGTKTASDFPVEIDGVTKTWGTQAVDAGTHTVSETTQTGYTASKWGGDCSAKGEVTLLPGERKTCTITNDDDIPSLTLKKEVINDNGGNAVPTDWTLTATGPTTLSGAGIATSDATFAAGTYTLTESGLTGYTAGSWTCTNDVVLTRGTITLSPGQSTVCTIVNDDIPPTVTLIKQLVGKDEIGDLNFGLTVGGTPVASGETLGVNANTQIALNEEGLPGYKFVSIGGTTESDRCPEVLGGTVTLNEGEDISCTITNEYVPAELTIAKYNTTWPTTTTPGSEVKYTLKLKVAKNNINNLLVVDLPANGFKYKTGSYNVQMNGVDVTSSIPEPQYHSPGRWELGDINLGENEEVEILLSYTATIDPNQKPGLYKDLAWAYGTEPGEDTGTTRLLASSVDAGTADPGIVTEQFVGSKVAINKETQSTTTVDVKKTETSTGEVLGASTTLPGTGASTIWTYIMSLLIGFGALSILMAILLKKGLFKKITLFVSALLLLGGVFMLPASVHAADPDLTIRISEPKTPINQTFDLIFVALDVQQTRPLTVRCYKKGPADAAYSQFGSDIAVIAGGNSGKCDVTDSLLSQKGTYNFYTTVEADMGAVSSQTVAVDYNSTDGPGTPTNYSKDDSSSCHPKISFKTSDDGGKTVKVEIYRSENTSFGVDAGNRVGTVTIGSNTDGSYTDTVPDCKKAYYYVIRAFDTAGNGSSVIGDSVVTVTTSSTTTTTTTTVAGGAIPVSGGTIPTEAQVLGEQTTVTPAAEQGSVLGKQTTIENKSGIGKVLGAMTSKSMRPWYIALAVLAVGIIGYVIYKKKNSNKENPPITPPQA